MPLLQSPLFRFCLAALVLLTLWVGGTQGVWSQDAAEGCDIALALDTDSGSDDTDDRNDCITQTTVFAAVAPATARPQENTRAALPSLASPPDHPPPEWA